MSHRKLFLLFPLLLLSSSALACAVPGSLSQGDSIADVFQAVHTSVVTLHTVSSAPSVETGGYAVDQGGTGSGVLISKDGDILTAAHVVQSAEELVVEFYDGTRATATIVSSDPLTDLAMVRLEGPIPEGIAVTRLGDSDQARVGSRVFAIGSPLGISHTLTVGYLSAKRITPSLVDAADRVEVLQTDAAINPGNSGGPLFNLKGEVIGVISYISTITGGNQGLGFAVSSNTCRSRFLERPMIWTGMEFISVRGRFAEVLNVPKGKSALLVQSVVPGSLSDLLGLQGGEIPADIGGLPMLLGGDLVLSVNSVDVGDEGAAAQIRGELAQMKPDDRIRVLILRAGRRIVLTKHWKDLQ
ncbi:MAG: serine protease Do [Candidatus Paceibacteria bacterium]|jgi:serine protease Do